MARKAIQLTLFAEPPDGNTGLLSAHNQVRVMLGHLSAVVLTQGRNQRPTVCFLVVWYMQYCTLDTGRRNDIVRTCTVATCTLSRVESTCRE